MGEEYETNRAPVLSVRAVGTTTLWRLELIRNGETIVSQEVRTKTTTFNYQDEPRQPGDYYYYVRVLQERAEDDNYRGMAVTSPIWITVK